MLGRIKVLENNVDDLYSMCYDELGLKMTSQCFQWCQNLVEYILKLKQDILLRSLEYPSDKTRLSNKYDKLSNLEYDLIELMETAKPFEPIQRNKSQVSKTLKNCKSCQRRTVHQDNTEKRPCYKLPPRSRKMYTNDNDCSSDNIEQYYEISPLVGEERVSNRKYVHQYPSTEFFSSSSSSSLSTVLAEEYYVVPKKRYNNYRVIREGLPLSVEKSAKPLVTKQIIRKSSKPRKPPNMVEFSISKSDPGNFPKSHYKQRPRRTKKRKKKNEDVQQGSKIYFVKKMERPIHSEFNIRESNKNSDANYIVSRLRRIPTAADFNNGDREKTVKFLEVNGGYPLTGEKMASNRGGSQTSVESKFIRTKWRRSSEARGSKQPISQSYHLNSSLADGQSTNVMPFSYRSYSQEYNNPRQSTQNCRGSNKQRGNLKKKTFRLNKDLIVNSHYEVVGPVYAVSLESRDFNPLQKNIKSLPPSCYNNHDKIKHTENENLSSHWFSEGKMRSPKHVKSFGGQNVRPKNQVNVYQIHKESHSTPFKETHLAPFKESLSTPFLRNDSKGKSLSGKMTPNKSSSSVFKPSKSTLQNPMSPERMLRSIDYTHSGNGFEVIGSVESPKKHSTTASVAKSSKPGLSNTASRSKQSKQKLSTTALSNKTSKAKSGSTSLQAKPSEIKLAKAGKKVRNLVKSVPKKFKRQDTKNSVIKTSESLPYFTHLEPNGDVESIYTPNIVEDGGSIKEKSRWFSRKSHATPVTPLHADKAKSKFESKHPSKASTKVSTANNQPSYEDEDSKSLQSGLLGNNRLSGRTTAKSFTLSSTDEANQRHKVNSSETNKPGIEELVYSLSYKRETCHDVECNDWPSTHSLDYFGPDCTTLLSEEKLDISEHKLNGSHYELHAHHIYPSTTDEVDRKRKLGKLRPKVTSLWPYKKEDTNSSTQNVPITKSLSIPHLDSDRSFHVDWKQIANDIKYSYI